MISVRKDEVPMTYSRGLINMKMKYIGTESILVERRLVVGGSYWNSSSGRDCENKIERMQNKSIR